MKEYFYSKIDRDLVAMCHELNEKNVPNVGSLSLKDLKTSIENSDYNEAIVDENKVVGFVVCFQDNDLTKSYMQKIKHKNFKAISNREDNFLYIDRIAVDAEYRNNKLGTSLYKNILNFAKENTIKNLTAEINLLPSNNEVSFKFHESFGFEEFGSVKYSEDYEVSLQKLMINS
tara:strand:+ start:357 stop:878 length:522 start_codon:yes stop_codon:yes gene_type:complete